MPRQNSSTEQNGQSGSKRGWGIVAASALFASILLPFGATQSAIAATSPWNQDSIYGCVEQPIIEFEVMPGVSQGTDEFRLTEGRLPDGLLLDARTGVIAGTPRGTYNDTFVIAARIDPEFPDQRFTALIEDRCRPAVDSIEPNKGSNLGGTEIVISGSGFDERATVAVDDAGTQIFLRDVKVERDRINAIMPAYSGSGLVTLIIRNPDGSRWVGKDAFNYDGNPMTPTQFLQPLIGGVPSFGTLRVGQPIADNPAQPQLGKVIRTDGTPGVFSITSEPLVPNLEIVTRPGLAGSTISAVVGTPMASGRYAFTITTRVEGADPDSYSYEFTGLVRYVSAQSVTFNGNGSDSGSMAVQSSDIKALLSTNTFARTGFTFNGWSTNAGGGGTTYLNNGMYEFAADATLYAQWAEIPPVTHTIVFNGNGATGGSMANQTSSAPAPVNSNQFVRSGYLFEEWNTQANGGGSVYYSGDTYSFTQDVTLYAIWKLPSPIGGGDEAVSHTVTYDGNGATSGATVAQVSRGQTALRENGFARPGFTFHAWNTNPDHSGVEYKPGDLFNFAVDLKLYAQWDKVPPAAVVITVDKPLTIDLLAGEVRTIIVKVANTAGELIPVTIEIPPGMIKTNSRVTITPRTTVASWAAGVIDVQIDFTDASGKDISVLDAPLEIHFATPLGLNTVGKSDDGRIWASIPLLAAKTLPANQADGYYLTPDGAVVILTRHLSQFGYKKGQRAELLTTLAKISLPVGSTASITTKGGNGSGFVAYKSMSPTLCSVSTVGLVKAIKVGSCLVSVSRNGDEVYVQSPEKLVKIAVAPGILVLEVQKAFIGNRPLVVAAKKVQIELGKVNANKTVGFEISPTSNGLYKVVGSIKLDKGGSATFTRTIVTGTTIRLRYLGKTLTTLKFDGKL